jgi:hypothetical protein
MPLHCEAITESRAVPRTMAIADGEKILSIGIAQFSGASKGSACLAKLLDAEPFGVEQSKTAQRRRIVAIRGLPVPPRGRKIRECGGPNPLQAADQPQSRADGPQRRPKLRSTASNATWLCTAVFSKMRLR